MPSSELFETLRIIIEVSMTWWVSSTLLCATILGFTWTKREEVREAGDIAFHGAFLLVTVFFVSICLFGVALWRAIKELGARLREACELPSGTCAVEDADLLSSSTQVGVTIGTSSFVLFTVGWIAAWIFMARDPRRASPINATVSSVTPKASGAASSEIRFSDEIQTPD